LRVIRSPVTVVDINVAPARATGCEAAMALTQAQMKQLQDEHVAAETRKDLAAAVAGYLEDCYYQNVPLGFRIQGRERVAAYYQRTWEALPDGEVTMEGEAFGDNVAVHWGTFRSTFRGKLLGAGASARRLEFPVISVLTFRDGKIRSYGQATRDATLRMPRRSTPCGRPTPRAVCYRSS